MTDVNEALLLTPGTFAVAENATEVGVVSAQDEDGGVAGLGAAVFTITGGADAALFTIEPSTGALAFNAPSST